MSVHILGICGTFMAGIATLAKELELKVEGSDENVYPPMSTQLESLGIRVHQGYQSAHLQPPPDQVIIGNVLSRGNEAIEHVLATDLPFTSGPAWIEKNVLPGRHVIAVAGTHGKTTTTAMIAWALEKTGYQPGFLIGGLPMNFEASARLGNTAPRSPFVIEADEYDSAFFDKRSKFVHYRPRCLIITGIEFDHVDIFRDLADIRRQFHHLIRIVPGQGLVLRHSPDPEVDRVLAEGCWSRVEPYGAGSQTWRYRLVTPEGSEFEVIHNDEVVGVVHWSLIGTHNVCNGLAAIAAVHDMGVSIKAACEALRSFDSVKRRLEIRGEVAGITVYDDFAHHPTAIRTTLSGLRARHGSARIRAIIDPASNTMRTGIHTGTLPAALGPADEVWIYRSPGIQWDVATIAETCATPIHVGKSIESIVEECVTSSAAGDHIVVMSNGSFGDIHEKLLTALRGRFTR